jgi:putative MATE family efflux protein
MKQPLGKAVKCPLFYVNLRLLFQKLKFWNSLNEEWRRSRMEISAGQDERFYKMIHTPVEHLVLTLGLPSIMINIISAAYNMADTYFVSYLGTSAVAGVGIVFPLMAVIQAVGFLFGQGSGNFISRELGARHVDGASMMAATGFFSALITGVFLCCMGQIFINPLIRLLGATPTILPHAQAYMRFILIGAPWMAGSLVLNSQLRFQGSSLYGMIGMISGAVLNIILDPLFIFVFHLGVMGASLATAISQFAGCAVLLVGCAHKGNISIHPRNFSPGFANYKEIFRGGVPSLLRQGLGSVVTIVMNHFARSYGDAAIAAIAIVNRLVLTANAIILGIGQGFQPVCGFNYGARRYDRVKKAFWFCVKIVTAVLFFGGALLAIFAPRIIALFRKEDLEVIRIGARSLRLNCFAMPFAGWIILANMMIQTMGKAKEASLLALARQGLFLIPFLFILTPGLGLLGIQISQPASEIAAFFFSIPLVFREFKKMNAGV